MNRYPEVLEFEQWLALLNVIARGNNDKSRLVQETDRAVWRPYWKQGIIPADALDEAHNTSSF